MAKLAGTALAAAVIVGIGAVGVCPADENGIETATDKAAQTDVRSIEDLLDASGYLNNRVEPLALGYTLDTAEIDLDLDFEDNSSLLGRLKRVRSLSLLTISSHRKSRLFLGVNEDGLLGLHLTASQAVSNDRTVELASLSGRDSEDD